MAQIGASIIGHQKVLTTLENIFAGTHIGSCYLFSGPSGIGKKKIAYALMQNVLCTNKLTNTLNSKSPGQACGQCGNCIKVEANQHEEILFIEPDGIGIKIQQSSEIHRFLNLRMMGPHRFVLIDEAQTLNAQSGNSLLKILEEPPERTTFFLITPSEHSVLRTLRSRSQVIHLSAIPKEELKRCTGAPDWIIESSQGRFDVIEDLKDPAQNELRLLAIDHLLKFVQSSFKEYSHFTKEILKDKTNALKILSFHQQILRDALYIQQNLNFPIHSDQKENLTPLASLPAASLHTLFEKLLQLERDLYGNVDKQLAYENLYLQTSI